MFQKIWDSHVQHRSSYPRGYVIAPWYVAVQQFCWMANFGSRWFLRKRGSTCALGVVGVGDSPLFTR